MEEPKGLIQVVNDRCCELYKNGMSEEEISEEIGIPIIRVKEEIHGRLIDKIWRTHNEIPNHINTSSISIIRIYQTHI